MPALRRLLPLYRQVRSAYDFADSHGITETALMPQPEVCRRFEVESGFSLDRTVTRYANLLHLRDKTVLGSTGRIVDEETENVLRFMGEHDYVTRNDFTLRHLRPVHKPTGIYVNMLGSHRGHQHMYHFMIERLQAFYYLLERLDPPQAEIKVLVRRDLPDYQRKAFEVISSEYAFLRFEFIPPGERWRIGTLCQPDVAQTALPAFVDTGFLDFLRRIFMRAYDVDPVPKARRRIYISRADAKLRRFMNADAIHTVMERHGFEPVLAAKLSFREQIETFRDASAIAGTHGAGFTNIPFAPRDAPLIEFFPADKMYPAYMQLSLAQDRPYHWLRGGSCGRREHFHLDPDELDAMLSRVLPSL